MSIPAKIIMVLLLASSFSTAFSMSSQECREIWDEILEEGELEELYRPLRYKCGDDFKYRLKDIIKTNKSLNYTFARRQMFSDLDNNNGEVCSVYSSKCLRTSGIPDSNVMNCEHSWPQSLGATGTAKSDLHHLFPVMAKMNSRRGNNPFCEVDEYIYSEDGSYLGESDSGTRCFEPPNRHKGDLARAMYYFSLRYNKRIDREQEHFFLIWNEEDPVSEKEQIRNDRIEEIQNNRNPFIDHPRFIWLVGDF